MNEDFYINLIYKKLSKEISPSEKKELDAWISVSEENKATALAVEQAWEASDLLQAKIEVDLDAEFQSIETKINEAPTSTKVIDLNNESPGKLRWLPMAAGFLLLIAAAFLMRDLFKEASPPAVEWIVVESKNEQKVISLPDQSKVYLNQGSEISYPSTFDRGQRTIKLKGEAFFEVEHQEKWPFTVETDKEKITVLGTSFNVQNRVPNFTAVYVATGKVQVEQIDHSNIITLKKGEKGISNNQQGSLKNMGERSENEIAWYTKKLKFTDVPFSKILEEVEDYYDVKLEIKNNELKNCPLTITFDNQPIKLVLESLATILELQIEANDNDSFDLNGGRCQ